MFAFDFTRIFGVFALVVCLFSGCRWFAPAPDSAPSAQQAALDELVTGIPFATKEPERFSAQIVISTDDGEHQTLIARNGEKRRAEYNFGTPDAIVAIRSDKFYRLSPASKTFVEIATPTGGTPDDWQDFLTTEWLNSMRPAKFEKLGAANGITQYRAVFSEVSEALVDIDESIGLPVKQRFFSVDGDRKTVLMTFELRNFTTAPDDALFEVPKDYRKVEKL